MSFFGVCLVLVCIFSLYFGYKIYKRLIDKKEKQNKKEFFGKVILFLFVNLIVVSLNLLIFILSYSYIWEKTFRAYHEQQYEALVIGYKKEEIKTQNFKGGGYYNKSVYFPKVKYKNNEEREIVKIIDQTSSSPHGVGEKIMITASSSQNSGNTLEVNWILFFFLIILIAVAAFFSSFLITYIRNFSIKKRIQKSILVTICITLLNVICVVLLYFKN